MADRWHDDLPALWPTGITVVELARRFGVHPDSVRKAARRLGLPPRTPGRKPERHRRHSRVEALKPGDRELYDRLRRENMHPNEALEWIGHAG